jgi:murein DD-endopeptidase MepM/ murein hydrolase activator NlpD
MQHLVLTVLLCGLTLVSAVEGPMRDSTQKAVGQPAGPASPVTAVADSAIIETDDDSTVQPADTQEDLFQQSLDSLFWIKCLGVDTAKWDTCWKVGQLDFSKWTDTARIVLVDSSKSLYYVHPFKNFITCDFGQRKWLWHYGVDIRLAVGDTVHAAFDGIARPTPFDRHGFGNVVILRHASGLETVYGHLSKKLVAPGQSVKAGDIVGLGGNTGHSTGSHLHFEIRYYGEPINPNDIVDFQSGMIKNDTLVLTKANFEYLIELRKQKWYLVRNGDNLGRIARQCHTTVAKLCALNHITGKTILRVRSKIRYQ